MLDYNHVRASASEYVVVILVGGICKSHSEKRLFVGVGLSGAAALVDSSGGKDGNHTEGSARIGEAVTLLGGWLRLNDISESNCSREDWGDDGRSLLHDNVLGTGSTIDKCTDFFLGHFLVILNGVFNLFAVKMLVVVAGVAGEVVVRSEGLVFGKDLPLYEAVESLKALSLSDSTAIMLADFAEDLRSRGILKAFWLIIAVGKRVWEIPFAFISAILVQRIKCLGHDPVVAPEVLRLEHSPLEFRAIASGNVKCITMHVAHEILIASHLTGFLLGNANLVPVIIPSAIGFFALLYSKLSFTFFGAAI